MKLIKYNEINEKQYEEYILEWENSKELIVPSASKRVKESFKEQIENWKIQETEHMFEKGFVPSTLYFLKTKEEKIVGSIHLRHTLNDRLLQNGGHIGYGIRPSERGKGYASIMLNKLLKMLIVMDYEKVLITCDDDNLGSVRTIEKNGGILESKPVFQGVLTRKYWVNLNNPQ